MRKVDMRWRLLLLTPSTGKKRQEEAKRNVIYRPPLDTIQHPLIIRGTVEHNNITEVDSFENGSTQSNPRLVFKKNKEKKHLSLKMSLKLNLF